MIYLDHAATAWPRPLAVVNAVTAAMLDCGNPGRGGHRLSLAAGRAMLGAREAVADLLGAPDPLNIAFTRNATEALNLALYGVLAPGDKVVISPLEHNAVMRPLRDLERKGVSVEVLPAAPDGTLDLRAAARAVQGARLLVAAHASNVLGTLQPLAELGETARRAGALFLVDGAQTAGTVPLNLGQLPVDLFAFPGHKGLLGPQGTGGLYMRPGLDLPPLVAGGTGSLSEQEEMPTFAPDRYEAGTPNVPGFAGLGAAASLLAGMGVNTVRALEMDLTTRFLEGIEDLHGVHVLGPGGLPEDSAARRAGLISLQIPGVDPDLLATVLEERYLIHVRAGLHCAPAAHRHAGTWPVGAVRFSFGHTTTAGEVDAAVMALAELLSSIHTPVRS